MSKRRSAPQGGFTVAEMMIVLVIVGILAAVAAPNMGAMIRTQRLKTAAFDVYSSLVFARSEAIKRNTWTAVTPTSSDWSKGWTITDANGNVLRQQSGWDAVQSSGPGLVRFNSSGRLMAAVADISLTAYGVETEHHRCVKIDASGRPVTKGGSC